MQNNSILKETLLSWLVVVIACRLAFIFEATSVIPSEFSFLITAAVLLYVPVFVFLKKKEKILCFEGSFRDFGHAIRDALGLSLVIFPLMGFLNHFYQSLFFERGYQASNFGNLLPTLFANRLVMAIPEEFFFRGYLQSRLDPVFPKKWRWFGVSVGPSLLIVSLVFALSHSLIWVQWWHAFIFFPSLAFGWLFEKRGTISGAILFHTFCNVFSDWVAFHYR